MMKIREIIEGCPQSRNVTDQTYVQVLYVRLFAEARDFIKYPSEGKRIYASLQRYDIAEGRVMHIMFDYIKDVMNIREDGHWIIWERVNPFAKQTICA